MTTTFPSQVHQKLPPGGLRGHHQPQDQPGALRILCLLVHVGGGRIFFQERKSPDRDDWQNRLNAMECALHLEKSVNPSLLELHKLATDKNDPHLCDFIETHYLNEQVKSIKELDLFDKHTLGNSDTIRVTFLVTEAVHACWGYLYLFYKLYQNIYFFHLYYSFK
ncbi:unnamed protein product [Nyctereutes procyonoides]|uniref:Ferritin n=1 Tax=Nyctereutes procyonoides TaxID=34880 RepID=A0A811ZGX8_NYCPR|nr:unnamed protein product [Nyctereutes procyonoides]